MNKLDIIVNLVERNLRGSVEYITDSNGDDYLTEESQELFNTKWEEIENMFNHLGELAEIGCKIPNYLTEDIEEFYINKVMPFDKRSLAEIIEEYTGAN